MSIALRIALSLLAVVAVSPVGAAKPDKPDCAASLAAVQVSVAAACDCATAVNHGQYVRCAGRVVKGLVKDSLLGKSCKGAMVRVFAKSSCGNPSSTTCCVPVDGTAACVVKKASVCAKIGGTPGATQLCADACSPSGAFID
jgi:hypothetical protein